MIQKINFSGYQNDIFDFVLNGKGNAVVSAVAGSGKTTTIVHAASIIPSDKKVLFLAFNKSIANELSDRLKNNKNVECKTLHAHGLSALKSATKFLKVLNCNRFLKTVREQSVVFSKILTVDSKSCLIYSYNANTLKLLDLCRINLISANDKQAIKDIAENYSIELVADEVDFVSYLLTDCYNLKDSKYIDFTDMLTLPVQPEFKKYIKKYDYIFIDECQDLSKAQRELMLNSLKRGGRFIAVGDKKQAINGFAGASCDSFDLIANLPNTKEFPLSVNYRCGKNIIDSIKDIVPNIEPFEKAIDGEVNSVYNFDNLKKGDMILCRITAPLIGLCFDLWKKNIPAIIKGTDICQNLLNLVYKMKATSVSDLLIKLDNEKENIVNELKKKGVKNPYENIKYINFVDKANCIESVAEGANTNDLEILVKTLTDMFSDITPNNSVCLSTVHKAKGLESDNVWIILPNKLPLSRPNQKDWELVQEQNLKYVAYTRAKKVLNLVYLNEKELRKIWK